MLGDRLAIEVKASKNLGERHFAGLRQIQNKKTRKIMVAHESRYRKTSDGIEVFPYVEFFKRLWGRDFF